MREIAAGVNALAMTFVLSAEIAAGTSALAMTGKQGSALASLLASKGSRKPQRGKTLSVVSFPFEPLFRNDKGVALNPHAYA